ncbi:MAG: hypothetical protein EZS28_025261 [Streblomastix strix]|uniref:Protein kinase domain-containing protein n=1 Tax=Streblomastix strix TaxID=222440 RepID=A0A5J4V9N5_9EUKA|nr:MAG: hypothetical protein EZS28_025261 [Streblomastix strix]
MTSKESVAVILKTDRVLDTLLGHTDEQGNLDASYFARVLTDSNSEFFAPLRVTSVFPEIRFFVVIAHLDLYSNIILEPIASEPSPDHFTMIIRHHPQDLDTLRQYFEEELQCYQIMLQNVKDLIYIGYGSITSGCCTIFLSSSTVTLEEYIQQGVAKDISTKHEITKSLIDSIQQAHENGNIGFDLRPSSILCTNRKGGFSVALIGYYGQENILAAHPDCSRIQLDRYWTAKELILQKYSRHRTASPNSSLNMSPSPSASSFQAFSPSIKPPSPPPSQSSLPALIPSIKPPQPPPSIQLIIKQPSAYPPFPLMTPTSTPPISTPQISTPSFTRTPSSTQTGFMVKPTKASDIYALGMLILEIYEKSPEAKELVSNTTRTAQLRCSIQDLNDKFEEWDFVDGKELIDEKKEINFVKDQDNGISKDNLKKNHKIQINENEQQKEKEEKAKKKEMEKEEKAKKKEMEKEEKLKKKEIEKEQKEKKEQRNVDLDTLKKEKLIDRRKIDIYERRRITGVVNVIIGKQSKIIK